MHISTVHVALSERRCNCIAHAISDKAPAQSSQQREQIKASLISNDDIRFSAEEMYHPSQTVRDPETCCTEHLFLLLLVI